MTAIVYAEETLRTNEPVVLLAIDDRSLPWQRGVYLDMRPPVKHPDNPVLERGREGACDFWRAGQPSVLHEDGRWRMWYVARHQMYGHDQIHIAYAQSHDGVHWEKPELGLRELNGNSRNNLVDCAPGLNSCTVIRDPDAPPDRRYVMVGEDMTDWVEWGHRAPSITRIDVSADGLHWCKITDSTSFAQVFEAATVYKFNGRYHIGGHQIGDVMRLPMQTEPLGGYLGPRTFVISRSPQLERWPDELVKGCFKPMCSSSPYRVGWDREELHVGAEVRPYGNVCVGVCGLWHHPINDGDPVYDSKLVSVDLGLLVSNDGLHFREPAPGYVLMGRDQELSWDRDWRDNTSEDNLLLMQGNVLNTDDETFFYYGASSPGGNVFEVSHNTGLARMPRDRFGCLRLIPGAPAGQCASCALTLDGAAVLSVNADVPAGSRLQVSLLDEDGLDALPGYGNDDGGHVMESGLDTTVVWGETTTLPTGRPFRIRAEVEGATELFALYIR